MSSFTHDIATPQPHDRGNLRASRPSFSSQVTADRLREGNTRSSKINIKKQPQRRSVFKEEGLDDLNRSVHPSTHDAHRNSIAGIELENGRDKKPTVVESLSHADDAENPRKRKKGENNSWYSKLGKGSRPAIKGSATAPPGSFSSVPRVALIVFLIAVVVPGFRYSTSGENISGADAGVIRSDINLVENGSAIEGRADTSTSICTRWAHQMANVNGTLYIYGGQAKSKSGQTENTWNNNFLSLDLTKSWNIASPVLKGLPQPSGPPAVAMGALWNSYKSLWLYGGMFSDSPATSPLPVSTWEYNLESSQWIEHSNPKTSAGNHSTDADQPVQRSAEGSGISVPELGRSWYFGGHLDLYTTLGWSIHTARIYIKSMLEFTHPGYANTGVSSLGSTKAAGSDGVYRNITEGGIQEEVGFTERADGVLVYVPGWGDEGILLGLAGGTNETFTEMNIIDVYDVANSTWYKQSTSGPSPPIRVNPCAVVAAAPDGTSFNIYLYGGQNLIPFGSQIQYTDMWILTVPSFTWIQVDMKGQSEPPARAGHSCTMWAGQLVVVGGYVGKDISCDSPGIYVFNASSLQWTNSFTALTLPSSSDSNPDPNFDSSVMKGSVGYQVPALVQSIIGGSSMGGATATTPAVGSATAGPIATGRPPSFTVTQSGSTVIQTSHSTSTGSPNTAQPVTKSGPNVGAISAGVIAACLAILAGYLSFCTWLYRRQLKLYKNHVAMAQRTAFNNSPDNSAWGGSVGGRNSEKAGGGATLGPFGTEIGGSGSAGRPSVGESYQSAGAHSGPSAALAPFPFPGYTPPSELTPSTSLTPGESSTGSGAAAGGYGGHGGGVMPGGGTAGKGYGRLSEDYEGAGYLGAGGIERSKWGSRHSAGSSTEDLLGGQEPSFFSVVLNPRRTLRVVNSD